MQTPTDEKHCQLMVIGAGMAGMAATLFAVKQGLQVAQAGLTGEVIYASGVFDLLGVYPPEKRQVREDPWRALAELAQAEPNHPYARLAPQEIAHAMDLLTEYLGEIGLPYTGHPTKNTRLLTSVGTAKPTFRLPISMAAGSEALAQKAPCLLVDLVGLRGFSARQMASTLAHQWPDLRTATVEAPGPVVHGPKYPEHVARTLEVEAERDAFAAAIAPHIADARYVGLPAVLGIYKTPEIVAQLEERLKVRIFEIPTMPPAITGLRLKEAFESHLPTMGVDAYYHYRVLSVHPASSGGFRLEIGKNDTEQVVHADTVVLATGRFLGKGLIPERDGIHEALLDLPVHQPRHRDRWYAGAFLAPEGHAVSRAGLEVDDQFRPVTADGRVVNDRLFAVGSILAHQDWMRTKSGVGIAVASAWKAVQAICAA
ncbi:MAG: glycerol-3-phosphate dehydrogenase subunit GlpB [Desulfosarcinaceae bacterium]|nr:glycerol-3-phosphate dehydrogenase subunit GlpB [Desulfosarcinaceae bacterium]